MEMRDAPVLSGPTRAPDSGTEARRLIVLLHGVGSNGDDLIGLAPHFAQVVPDAEFLAPNAPFDCEHSPMGYQWFDITGEEGDARLAQLRHAASIVDAFLDTELARRGLVEADLALIGFSQGTMISLFVGLRRHAACAGILGYSGRLEAPHLLADEIRCRPRVMLIHGEQDDRLPVALMDEAQAALSRNGVSVVTHRRPRLGHGIDQDGVMLGAGFLASLFKEAE
jgi:phospholipase/carboxylesterase